MKNLRAMGLWLELVTGDTQRAADELGKQASFDRLWERCVTKTSYVVGTN